VQGGVHSPLSSAASEFIPSQRHGTAYFLNSDLINLVPKS